MRRENLSFKVIDEKYGCLCVKDFTEGFLCGLTGWFPHCKKQIESLLAELESQKINQLILDLRNNKGGDDRMAMLILSYLTDKSFSYYADAEEQNDGIQITKAYNLVGNGKASSLSVVILVNANTISAADGLAYRAAQLKNVTLLGMTTSNNSYQSVGGKALLRGNTYVAYPHIFRWMKMPA